MPFSDIRAPELKKKQFIAKGLTKDISCDDTTLHSHKRLGSSSAAGKVHLSRFVEFVLKVVYDCLWCRLIVCIAVCSILFALLCVLLCSTS